MTKTPWPFQKLEIAIRFQENPNYSLALVELVRRVAALIAAILLVTPKKMILVLMPYRNSACRTGSDKQQSNMGLRYKVFGSLNLGQYLEKFYGHHHLIIMPLKSRKHSKSVALVSIFLC